MKLPDEERLELEDVRQRSKELFKRFEGTRGLHAKVKWRQQHFYLAPEADPLMPGSTRDGDGKITPGRWQNAATQTTWVQDTYFKWRSRVNENAWKIEGRPMVETIPNKAKANEAEALLIQGFEFIRERTGIDLQDNLSFGKAVKAAGILHWRIDESAYKANMPDYEELDDLTADMEDSEKKRYEKTDKGYRETSASLEERIARYKAECGFPVWAETVPIEQCAWTRDKSTYSEFKEFGVKRVIPTLGDWKEIKLKDIEKKLLERESPAQEVLGTIERWTPSAQDYRDSREIVVYQYWTRRYWYEWAECDGEDYFDWGEHIHGMCPFAIDPGRFTDTADPMWAYQPVFHSMLEEKPNFDRLSSLTNAAVEGAAIPVWVLQPTTTGTPSLSTDGDDPLDMAADSGDASRVPGGYRLETVGGVGVNNQLLNLLEQSRQAMEHAEPSTGFATFSATTAPTSAWQEQAQENMEPKQHIRGTARTLQVMVNNVIRCFADAENGPGEVFGYAKSGDGALDRTKVLSMKPEEWTNIIADVKIVEVGNVERAALEDLGMTKLAKGLITDIEYIGDYEGQSNPEQIFVTREAWKGYKTEVLGTQIRQAMAKAFGVEIALAPGAVPMINGQQVTDQQAVSAAGGTPQGGGQLPGSQGLINAAPTMQSNAGMPQPQIQQPAPQQTAGVQ